MSKYLYICILKLQFYKYIVVFVSFCQSHGLMCYLTELVGAGGEILVNTPHQKRPGRVSNRALGELSLLIRDRAFSQDNEC